MAETEEDAVNIRFTTLEKENRFRQTDGMTKQTENIKKAVKEEVVKSICYLLALICWLLLGTLVFIGIEG